MNPHYYLMKNKKILRLEDEINFKSLPDFIQEKIFLPCDELKMNQDQANWRVVLFRDEIMELEEYQNWLNNSETQLTDEYNFEYDLTAN